MTAPVPVEQQTACHDCDLLLALPELSPGQRATCPRCGTTLTSNIANLLERLTAFSLAALIMLAAALNYPFLTLSASGLSNVMTLIEAIDVMIQSGETATAMLISAFVVFIPGTMMAALLLLALLLKVRGPRGLAGLLARSISQLEQWAMVEVFIIGVIVSLVKIVSMADVQLGWSFWAYLMFAVLFVEAISHFDRLALWRRIEGLGPEGRP